MSDEDAAPPLKRRAKGGAGTNLTNDEIEVVDNEDAGYLGL